MAHLAGLDPEAWASRALISAYDGSEKGELLKQALKKAFVATGAALLLSGNVQAATVEMVRQVLTPIDTMCIMLSYVDNSENSNHSLMSLQTRRPAHWDR